MIGLNYLQVPPVLEEQKMEFVCNGQLPSATNKYLDLCWELCFTISFEIWRMNNFGSYEQYVDECCYWHTSGTYIVDDEFQNILEMMDNSNGKFKYKNVD